MSPPILITAGEMVDMALGASNYNTINLAVLHSLLHVIVQKMHMEDTKIEFRGVNHEVFEQLISEMPGEKYVRVKEYKIECVDDCETRVEVESPEVEENRIVSVFRSCCDPPKLVPPGFPLRALELTEIFKNHIDPDTTDTPPSIHNLVAETLPENAELVDVGDDGSNLLKMCKLLNITHRVEAVEISLKTLAEVVQVIHDKATEMINLIISSNLRETAKLIRVIDCNLRDEVRKITLLQVAVREIQLKICELIDSLPERMEQFWISKGMENFHVDELEARLKYLDDNKVDRTAFEDAESCIQRIYKFEDEFVNTMKDIQKMIDAKFDNCHVPDLKEFIEKYLTAFKTQLDYLTTQICDNSAGGTYKVLRDLNCISCRKFISQRDQELLPPVSLLPKSIPQKVKEHKPIRFCGGSHTLIAPNEKFAVSLNFNEEYGPPPPSSPIAYVKGSDGAIYMGDRPKVFKCCGVCAQCSYQPNTPP